MINRYINTINSIIYNPKGFKRKLIIIALGLLSAFIFYLSSYYKEFTEEVYSKVFYKSISQILSSITGIVPVSVFEIIILSIAFIVLSIILTLIYTMICFIINVRINKNSVNNKKNIHNTLIAVKNFTINSLCIISIIYTGFVLLWGLNYNRLTFAEIAGYRVEPTSVKVLSKTCESLIDKLNIIRTQVSQNSEGVMVIESSKTDLLKRANAGYNNMSELQHVLGGRYGNPKGIFISELMNYTGITGIYFPFTTEANVNMSNVDSMLPVTVCHEMAHQRGFAREDEANFIAYLVCKHHPDIDYKYSGYLLATIHSMNALYSNDRYEYMKLREKYSQGVINDLNYMNQFWKKYEGSVQEISNNINNTYLKANLQQDGVKSYGRMVDLLVAEFISSNI